MRATLLFLDTALAEIAGYYAVYFMARMGRLAASALATTEVYST
jgi:drug/metabolite transporter superfamily protein YnfA